MKNEDTSDEKLDIKLSRSKVVWHNETSTFADYQLINRYKSRLLICHLYYI